MAKQEGLSPTTVRQRLVLARLLPEQEELFLTMDLSYPVISTMKSLEAGGRKRILEDARSGKKTTLRERQAGLRLVKIPKKELPEGVRGSIEGRYIQLHVRLPWKPSRKEELRRELKRIGRELPGSADAALRAWRRRSR